MDCQELADKLRDIILPVLEIEGIELVDLDLTRSNSEYNLRLLVDTLDGGINLNECAQLNRKIGDILEAQDLITDKYILEVSSPGLDWPLKTKSDFLRNINKNARVFLKEQVEGKCEIEGKIIKVENDLVCVETQNGILGIPLVSINKAKQII